MFETFYNLGHAFARCFDRLRRAMLGLLDAVRQVFPKPRHLFSDPPHGDGVILAHLFKARFKIGAVLF